MHKARILYAAVRFRALTTRSQAATLRIRLVQHYSAQPPTSGGAEHIPTSRVYTLRAHPCSACPPMLMLTGTLAFVRMLLFG
jgi:hypothetical protein